MLVVLALGACSTPGEETLASLLGHTEAMLQRLEEHRDSPEAALRALARYEKRHGDEIDRLRRRAGELQGELGGQGLRTLRRRYRERAAELSRRLERLRVSP